MCPQPSIPSIPYQNESSHCLWDAFELASRKLWECKMCYVFVDYVVQINTEADTYMSVCFALPILWVYELKQFSAFFWRAENKARQLFPEAHIDSAKHQNVSHDLAVIHFHIFLQLYLSNKKFNLF